MTTETTRWEYTNFLIQYKTRTEDPVAYSYDLECTRFKVLTVTLDFTGSKNFAIDGQKDMKITVVIRPFSRVHVGRVQVIDCYKSAQIKMDCDYEMSDPSPEETAAYIKTHKLKMGPILKEAVVLPFPPAAVDITDEHVHQVCQSYGKKFVDKDFLPTASSLFKTDESAKSTKGASTTAKKESRQVVEWKRAADFMKGEYHVFESGIEPADIKQGNEFTFYLF